MRGLLANSMQHACCMSCSVNKVHLHTHVMSCSDVPKESTSVDASGLIGELCIEVVLALLKDSLYVVAGDTGSSISEGLAANTNCSTSFELL